MTPGTGPVARQPGIGDAVLVTGAASGIGRGVAARFAHAGWHVLALDRDAARLTAVWGPGGSDAAAGGPVTPVAADITDAAALTAALRGTGTAALRACVNVAGVYPASTFLDFSYDDYRLNFDVNVLGTLTASRAALPYLRAASAATIVNFASTAAFAPGDGRRILYKAAKAAVVAITRSMAFELAAERIAVVGVAPGPVETEGSAAYGDIGRFAGSVPLGRNGTPADMAAWVWALAGSNPLPFITGETIVVSGGAFMR